MTLADNDGIAALYEGLDPEDRQRRFFTAYRPQRDFLEKEATTAERGGFGLVAVVTGEDGPGSQIVALANYVLLPDGAGELGVTVAKGWRGWLGPFLLDALLEAAAARGVENLEADILVANGPMLALVRSRGCATMAHPDWTVVRVVFGTSSRMPTWPGPHDRPRILVEVPGGRWHAEDAARAAGLQVLACSGPGGAHARCPALAGEPCPLASGADVIVVSCAPDDERWAAVLGAHPQVHAGIPVCVENPAGSVGASPHPEPVDPTGPQTDAVAALKRLAGRRSPAGAGPYPSPG